MTNLDLTTAERAALWQQVTTRLEQYYADMEQIQVSPKLDQQEIRTYVRELDFDAPAPTAKVVDTVMDGLKSYAVHTPHPSYFGLFNPRPNFPSILADTITAGYNPQMAAWSHAPYAAECESYMIEEIGVKFGWSRSDADGTFCSGGAEANLTAVLCALQEAYPAFANEGVIGIDKRPVIYTSIESHHSIARAARIAGLGASSVHNVPVDVSLSMDVEELKKMIAADKLAGLQPIMVAATAGTTGPGAIDPLQEISTICNEEKLWYHVDGAYGGALILNEDYKTHLLGISAADSITFDIHKWTSVPMAASLFLTRHKIALSQTFRINADYMPKDTADQPITDPYAHSIQWSRRFIGLKLYMTLASFGWQGMSALVDHTCAIGNFVRSQLEDYNWNILNNSVMPIVCFSDDRLEGPQVQALCDQVNQTGETWISTYPIAGRLALRVCITNYKTSEQEIIKLATLLDTHRTAVLEA